MSEENIRTREKFFLFIISTIIFIIIGYFIDGLIQIEINGFGLNRYLFLLFIPPIALIIKQIKKEFWIIKYIWVIILGITFGLAISDILDLIYLFINLNLAGYIIFIYILIGYLFFIYSISKLVKIILIKSKNYY